MAISLDSLDFNDIARRLIDIAAGKIPSPVGGVVGFVAKEMFFPAPEVDIWGQIEKRVETMVNDRSAEIADQVVNRRYGLALMARLRGFSNGFRDLLLIADDDHRNLQLALLSSQLDQLTGELILIPPALLPAIPSVLRPLALTHIALLQEARMQGSGYRHQAAINRAAIRYSDLAGRLFESFLAWRRAQIAEGRGTIVMTDLSPTETHILEGSKFKRVEMIYYDKYYNEIWQGGENGAAVVRMTTGDVREDRVSLEFEDLKLQMYQHMQKYDQQVVALVTKQWETQLLSLTQQFMNFVDWDGVNKEKQGRLLELRAPRIVFPNHGRPRRKGIDPLPRIDAFLEQQMDAFRVTGPRFLQTFRVMDLNVGGPAALTRMRADTYDTAMALIYLLQRERDARATVLADALALAVERDARGGGRIIAASMANRLFDPELAGTTSIHPHDGGNRDVGNASWTGIALCRAYRRFGNYRHLDAALAIGTWISTECRVDDDWGGFSGGEDTWANRRKWRSVEHNVDAHVLFAQLSALTGDKEWSMHSQSAARLVRACWLDTKYCTGTGVGMTLNRGVIPTDCQSWTGLTNIDPDRLEKYLGWMNRELRSRSAGFDGFRFALAGAEVQNEATAGALMAMYLAGGELRRAAEPLFEQLIRQQSEAPGTDGLGLVATPAAEAKTGEGLGWSYFNHPHVAASAWTGLALLAREDVSANPYWLPLES